MGKMPVVGLAGMFLAGTVLCGCQNNNKVNPTTPTYVPLPAGTPKPGQPTVSGAVTQPQPPGPGQPQLGGLGQPQSGAINPASIRPGSTSSSLTAPETNFGGSPITNSGSGPMAGQRSLGGSSSLSSSGAITDTAVKPASVPSTTPTPDNYNKPPTGAGYTPSSMLGSSPVPNIAPPPFPGSSSVVDLPPRPGTLPVDPTPMSVPPKQSPTGQYPN